MMQLHRIPYCACSTASVLVIAITPPLAAV